MQKIRPSLLQVIFINKQMILLKKGRDLGKIPVYLTNSPHCGVKQLFLQCSPRNQDVILTQVLNFPFSHRFLSTVGGLVRTQ